MANKYEVHNTGAGYLVSYRRFNGWSPVRHFLRDSRGQIKCHASPGDAWRSVRVHAEVNAAARVVAS